MPPRHGRDYHHQSFVDYYYQGFIDHYQSLVYFRYLCYKRNEDVHYGSSPYFD